MIEIDGEFFEEPTNNYFPPTSLTYNKMVESVLMQWWIEAIKICFIPPKPGPARDLIKDVMPDEFLNWCTVRDA